jgi:hypothetical protein
MFMTTGAPQRWVTPSRDRLVDRPGLDAAQADMRSGECRDGPREAPAVAVEHRQGPQTDRMLPHAPDEDIAERVQVGTAVVIDAPLRVACRTDGERPLRVRLAGLRGSDR